MCKNLKEIDIYYSRKDKWSQLSNLAPRPFIVGNRKYFSVEHCYQSWKTGKFDRETYLKYNKGGIKIKGKPPNMGIVYKLMRKAIRISLSQNPKDLDLLLSTGESKLTHNLEDGYWGEKFPEILMFLRKQFRDNGINKKDLSNVTYRKLF